MDRTEAMAVFVRVVEEGDFSAAARRLRLTPSAVSKIVGRLEDRLGVRLLLRSTRRLGLTDEGRIYVERARRILADLDEADRAVQPSAEPRGRLRVHLPLAFGHRVVVPLLPGFVARCPGVELELTFSDALVDLLEVGADVAIRVADLGDSRLVARRLATNRRVICAAPSYLERRGVPATPADLPDHSCLCLAPQNGLNAWEFDGPQGRYTVRVHGAVEANTTEALHRFALAGMGLVRLGEFVVGEDLRAGRLVPVLTGHNHAESPPVCAVYPHRRHLPARVRAFVDYMADRFAEPQWPSGAL